MLLAAVAALPEEKLPPAGLELGSNGTDGVVICKLLIGAH